MLRCCEHLVSTLGARGRPDPALAEALWTGALVRYVRCSSAQANDGTPAGVAVAGGPLPLADEATVRMLGRVVHGLSGLLDARMQECQGRVLAAAAELTPGELARLPLVHLSDAWSPAAERALSR